MTPSFVTVDITFGLERYSPEIRKEWDSLRPHDILFLVSLQMLPETSDTEMPIKDSLSGAEFRSRYGVKHIRGCEIYQILNDNGDPIYDFETGLTPNENGERQISTHSRTLRVLLDTNQYFKDLKATNNQPYEIYESFNVIVRRNPAQNNFKCVLETIRDLMQSQLVVPSWLEQILLGYGDRDSAHYSKIENPTLRVDFRCTFIDEEHLISSFPDYSIDTKGFSKNQPLILNFPQGNDTKIVCETSRTRQFESLKAAGLRYTPRQGLISF